MLMRLFVHELCEDMGIVEFGMIMPDLILLELCVQINFLEVFCVLIGRISQFPSKAPHLPFIKIFNLDQVVRTTYVLLNPNLAGKYCNLCLQC